MKKTYFVLATPQNLSREGDWNFLVPIQAPEIRVEMQVTHMGRNNDRKMLRTAWDKCKEWATSQGFRMGGMASTSPKLKEVA